MIPGEILTLEGDIALNVKRRTQTIAVSNSGDRPIQVGSHYHFFETNNALQFDRAVARGMRLNIAAGTAVRFEPGQSRTVELVDLAGSRTVYGFQGRVMAPLAKASKTTKASTSVKTAKTAAATVAKTKAKQPASKKPATKKTGGKR